MVPCPASTFSTFFLSVERKNDSLIIWGCGGEGVPETQPLIPEGQLEGK